MRKGLGGRRARSAMLLASPPGVVLWVQIGLLSVALLALLLNSYLGPLTPLTIFAVVAAYVVLFADRLPQVAKIAWPLLLIPLLALLSVFWSPYPAATLRYGFLFLVTVFAGVMFGCGLTRTAFLKGTFLAFFIFAVLSLMLGRWVGWGAGGAAYAGLLASKNAAGEVAGVTLIMSLAAIAWASQRKERVWLLCAWLALPISLWLLWSSKATGALIGSVVASTCLLLWLLSRRLPVQARISLFIVVLVSVVALVIAQDYWFSFIYEAVLESSGKDSGLTGRADLWLKADSLIAARPWFGLGFNGFWVHNNLDAEYMWRMMGIKGRSGFNFHNTPREILVHLGIVGLALYAIVVGFFSVVLFSKAMVRSHVDLVLCCALWVFFAMRLPFESFGFGGMHFSSIIIFALLSLGMAAREDSGDTYPAKAGQKRVPHVGRVAAKRSVRGMA
ncbi:O-antigen ligase family protein [Croceicoccus sp. F390]|uniref:O-antigen ligase family protein n=1 Tax=Croceicoccus esteveae TaxID=3075597 RepID=A0ABU2ZFH9_9SPHN|nr:O-antigen ligase family protein [Croceicoccus sp. F390]MDT0575059.1 O-antigen ligase family protein [Croceicoccus sp. F390]